jgi:thioredoxin-dependent peroxiredoxin
MNVALGKPIPYFEIPATSDLIFNPTACKGRKLVIYFYPKDSTPGCTAESMEFRDTIEEFTKANTLIVGISRDSLKSHENFKSKLELPFELLSDSDETVCQIFGVMKMKNMYGKQVRGIERSTFLIDEEGILRHEWRGLKIPGHVQDVLKASIDL